MTTAAQASGSACPLCESNNTRPRPGYRHIMQGNWSISRCSDCRTSFTYPVPDNETLQRYYDEDYYGGAEDGKFVGIVEGIVRFFRLLRAKAVTRLIPQGPVLDIGCGRGVMLKLLKSWGHEVDGIELDTIAAVRARKNLNQKIFCSLEELSRCQRRQYQAVCLWHSLEHLPQPAKALDIAGGLLAPGGLLVISAPHMESLQSRLSGASWLHLDVPRHLVHFDMKRLAGFLQARGYRLVRHQHFSQEYNVIDTLCYLYAILGFHHLYPFNLIHSAGRHKACSNLDVLGNILGLSLLFPLVALAFCLANFFSLLGSGSTETLFLMKQD